MIGRALVRAWVLLALAFGGAGGAWAQNFDFRYTISGVNVAGTFVTTARGGDYYLVTDIINGFRGGNAITLLAPRTFEGNTNLLYPYYSAYFDGDGLSYQSNGRQYNLYDSGGNRESDGVTSYAISNFTVTQAAPAPHPGGGGLSFLALGLVGLGCYRRKIVGQVRSLTARPVSRFA